MPEALSHRLVQPVARADALQHDGQLRVAERHAAADPGNVPSGRARPLATGPSAPSAPVQPASRDAPGIPAGALVTVMIYRIAGRSERKILTPQLWTLLEW